MAMKSSPLPRNTVAKNRSSPSPIRSRTTPMNQRKAMPANGSRFKARSTAFRLEPSASQSPASFGSLGRARRTSTIAAMSSPEKAIPATAAARGVLIACLVIEVGCVMRRRGPSS